MNITQTCGQATGPILRRHLHTFVANLTSLFTNMGKGFDTKLPKKLLQML